MSDAAGPGEEATAPTIAAGAAAPAAAARDGSTEETVAAGDTPAPAGLALDPAHLPTIAASTYQILGEHGRGGLGRILRARDTRTGRVVAIKEILAAAPEAAARFVREALVTANLQHPAIVPVYEVGRWPDGQPFYAMKLVAGGTLSAAIASAGTLAARLALLPHVAAVADALAYAHGAGVIHRDLKPGNVLVGDFGETVVIDWGLATRGDDDAVPLPELVTDETRSGAVMGTPAYMPPEQATGAPVDARSDVYAIGAILYQLLTGAAPHADAQTAAEVIARLRAGRAPAALAELVPEAAPDLIAIATTAMAPAPDARYPSAAELAADLRRFMTGQLVGAHRYTARQRLARWLRRNRAPVAVGAVAAVALAGFGAYSLHRIVDERDAARAAQARAETSDAAATARLASAYEERARAELLAGRPQRALPLAVEAMRLGRATPALRFLAARAAEPLREVVAVRDVAHLRGAAFVPGSHDLLYVEPDHVTRWDPERDRIAWRADVPGADVVVDTANPGVVLATANDGLVVLDARTGHARRTLLAPGGGRADSIDGGHWPRVVSTFVDGRVVIWNGETGAVETTLRVPGRGAEAAVLSPDQARLAIGAYDPKDGAPATLWDRATGRQLAQLCPPTAQCAQPRWSPDGAALILPVAGQPGDATGTITVADRDGRPRYTITTDGGVSEVVVGVDAFFLSTLGGTVEARALADGARRWQARFPDGLQGLAPSADARVVSVVDSYGTSYVLDAATGIELSRLSADDAAQRVITSTDGARLAPMALDRPLVVLRAAATTAAAIAPTPTRVRRTAFAPDGAALFTGSEDGTVARYDVADGALVRVLGVHRARVSGLLPTADGRRLVTTSRDGTAAIWDLRDNTRVAELQNGAGIIAAELSPDGARLVTADSDGVIRQWDLAHLAVVGPRLALRRDPMAVRWSPDGQRLAAIDEAGEVHVWDATTGAEQRVLEAPDHGHGIDLAWSPDGARLATARDGDHQIVLDLGGGKDVELQGLAGRTMIFSVRFDRTGDRLLGGSDDGRVRVWDRAGALRTTIEARHATLLADWSPDGALIATGDLDAHVRIWDAATGGEIASRLAPSSVYGLRFDGKGDALAIATLGAALIWRVGVGDASIADLERIARCRAGWRLAPDGLVPVPIALTACR